MALGTTGITTSVVSQEISLSSNDVGELCQGIKLGSGLPSKINKWSKYKPVNFNSTSTLTDTDFRTVKYGFNIPTSVTASALGVWVYQIPTGGANSPYRLGDFRGYNHSSTRQMSDRVFQIPYVGNGIKADITLGSLDTELKITDIFNDASYYFGFEIYSGTDYKYINTPVCCGTSTYYIGHASFSTLLDIPSNLCNFTNDQYIRVYLFLTKVQIPFQTGNMSAQKYSLNFDTLSDSVFTYKVGGSLPTYYPTLINLAKQSSNSFTFNISYEGIITDSSNGMYAYADLYDGLNATGYIVHTQLSLLTPSISIPANTTVVTDKLTLNYDTSWTADVKSAKVYLIDRAKGNVSYMSQIINMV